MDLFISNTETQIYQIYHIIRVYPESYFKEGEHIKVIKYGMPTTLIVLEITTEALIGKLIFDKTSIEGQFNNPIQNIFGSFNDKSKNANYKASNCLFEFRNGLNMSNIAKEKTRYIG